MRERTWMAAVVLGISAASCTSPSDEPEHEAPAGAEENVTADAPAAASPVGERLERATRAVDRGEKLDDARKALEAVVADKAATSDQRDEARLSLSRLFEQQDDDEAAIDVVEELLASHWENGTYAARDAAERRLRQLLTGKEEGPTYRLPRAKSLPPAATAMAKLYAADADGRFLIDMAIFGSSGRVRSEAFEVAEAKREEQALALSKNGWVGQSIMQTGSWVSISSIVAEKRADMPQADRSLLVFYYDLGDNRVPSRYDAYLPMPSEAIAAVLAGGEGLVMARKRDGAKPVIVIAAPRAGQLPLVEEAFARMSDLPYEPVKVAVPSKLTPDEIQARVRASFGSIRSCYEELLSRDPKAEGEFAIDFVIGKDGKVTQASIGKDSSVRDAKLEDCIVTGTRKLEFPATDEPTTVRYPIAISP